MRLIPFLFVLFACKADCPPCDCAEEPTLEDAIEAADEVAEEATDEAATDEESTDGEKEDAEEEAAEEPAPEE